MHRPAQRGTRRVLRLMLVGSLLALVGACSSDEGKETAATKPPATSSTTTDSPTASPSEPSTSDGPTSESSTSEPTTSGSTTPPQQDGCVVVSTLVRDYFDGVEITGAAVAPESVDGSPRWYYSTPEGATWVSASTPDGSEPGPTLPTNDQARAASELGAEVSTDAPDWNGASDNDPAAEASRECAKP